MHRAYRLAAPLIAVLLLAACGGTSSPSVAGTAGTTVAVTLQEFSILVDSATAPAGSITFSVQNIGPEDVHEFVIVKTDLDPGDLPTDDEGAVTEEGEGMEVINEIEDIAVDATQELTVNLDAGKYVLICNIVEDGEVHYAQGMRTAFTVE
jgi:uncharacterized cupredoxin-like copper-binding protein